MKLFSVIAALVCCAAFFLEEIDALDDAAQCESAPDQAPEANDDSPIWWDYSIDELFTDLFNCGEILYDVTPAPVTEKDIERLFLQFDEIRNKYAKEVNLLPIQQPTPDNRFSIMVVPTEIKDAGGKGRGVFAAERIEKGSLVLSLNAGNVGIFKDGATWRSFAATLPRETACNFIEWSWVQEITPEKGKDDIREGLTIFVAFDESNLLNGASEEVEGEGWVGGEEANIRCGTPLHSEHYSTNMNEGRDANEDEEERWGPCRFDYYATRDIEAGEELLLNYGEFEDEDQHQWTDIGL